MWDFKTCAHCLVRNVIGYPKELQTNRERNPTSFEDLDGELILWTLPRFSFDDVILNRDLDGGTFAVIHMLRLNRDSAWHVTTI